MVLATNLGFPRVGADRPESGALGKPALLKYLDPFDRGLGGRCSKENREADVPQAQQPATAL